MTAKSLVVYAPEQYAGSVFQAVEQGLKLASSVAVKVAKLLPFLVLNARYEVCRQHLALMGLWEGWAPEGFRYRSDRLVLDFSKLTAEIEAVDRRLAVDDMLKYMAHVEAVIRE